MTAEQEQEQEQVLAVSSELFRGIGHFSGFNPNAQPYMDAIYLEGSLHSLDREAAEIDPNWKQIIPYALFERTNPETGRVQLFRYYRGDCSGEQRLVGKASLGVGGHINPADAGDDTLNPFEAGLQREVEEEVLYVPGLTAGPDSKLPGAHEVGLINDESDAVGRVHLGVVLLYRIGDGDLKSREDELRGCSFVDVAELYKTADELERWSQLCLKTLYPLAEYFTPDDYVGMPHAAATSLAASSGTTCRVTKIDGAGGMATMDYVPSRINFEVEDGKVVRVTRG